jgi:hypothetical protein
VVVTFNGYQSHWSKILSRNMISSANLPDSINTPEINIHFDKQGQQFDAMKKLASNIDFIKEQCTCFFELGFDKTVSCA